MNGMELLKLRLSEMGCSKAQIDSKVVPMVASILTNEPKIIELGNIEKEVNNLEVKAEKLNKLIMDLERQYEELKRETVKLDNLKDAKDYYNEISLRCDELDEELKRWNEALNNADTMEARDTLRKAQLFIQNVIIDTKYDNTEYIKGLALILSSGTIAPINELKKINCKVERDTNIF